MGITKTKLVLSPNNFETETRIDKDKYLNISIPKIYKSDGTTNTSVDTAIQTSYLVTAEMKQIIYATHKTITSFIKYTKIK